jgi:hypothetical protein
VGVFSIFINMKKIIKLSESELINLIQNVTTEQNTNNDYILSFYEKIKNNPLVKKIESLYDVNPNKFLDNVIGAIPKLNSKRNQMLSKFNELSSNPEPLIKQYGKTIEDLGNKQLQEQGAVFATSWMIIIAIMLIVGTLEKRRYKRQQDKLNVPKTTSTSQPTPTPTPTPKSESDTLLEEIDGKTINLYNDIEEQILFGRDIIYKPRFVDSSKNGGRSSVTFGFGQMFTTSPELKDVFGDYEVICLSNPDRLAPFIVKKGKYDITSRKYNKKFTDFLNEKVGQFCKKPQADFGVNKTKRNSDNIG